MTTAVAVISASRNASLEPLTARVEENWFAGLSLEDVCWQEIASLMKPKLSRQPPP